MMFQWLRRLFTREPILQPGYKRLDQGTVMLARGRCVCARCQRPVMTEPWCDADPMDLFEGFASGLNRLGAIYADLTPDGIFALIHHLEGPTGVDPAVYRVGSVLRMLEDLEEIRQGFEHMQEAEEA